MRMEESLTPVAYSCTVRFLVKKRCLSSDSLEIFLVDRDEKEDPQKTVLQSDDQLHSVPAEPGSLQSCSANLPFVVRAPPGCDASRALPTVIAISGREQNHVSEFFRSLRAEERCAIC